MEIQTGTTTGFVVYIGDRQLLVVDENSGRSITNAASSFIECLDQTLPDGIAGRRVIYRDTSGRVDVIVTDKNDRFSGFAPGTTEDRDLAERCCH